MCGSRIGFFSGDVKTLVSDIQVLKPTLFISVPRLLNRIYDKVSKWIDSSIYRHSMDESKDKWINRLDKWTDR